MEPYNYILQVPGKQVQEKLIHVSLSFYFEYKKKNVCTHGHG